MSCSQEKMATVFAKARRSNREGKRDRSGRTRERDRVGWTSERSGPSNQERGLDGPPSRPEPSQMKKKKEWKDGWMDARRRRSEQQRKTCQGQAAEAAAQGIGEKGKKVKGNVAFVKELETSFEIMLGNNGPGSCYGDSGDTLILWGGTKCPS